MCSSGYTSIYLLFFYRRRNFHIFARALPLNTDLFSLYKDESFFLPNDGDGAMPNLYITLHTIPSPSASSEKKSSENIKEKYPLHSTKRGVPRFCLRARADDDDDGPMMSGRRANLLRNSLNSPILLLISDWHTHPHLSHHHHQRSECRAATAPPVGGG